METLIILIGAIIILSIAFYMAREKSFLPPEETNIKKMDGVEETIPQKDADKQESEELLAQLTPKTEAPNEIGAMREPDVYIAEDQENAATEDSIISTSETESEPVEEREEERVVSENIIKEDNGQLEESTMSGPVYTVQVGYFSVENNARGLAKEIEEYGYRTFVLEKDGAYKVQVGAYPVRSQAEKASQELKNLGYEIWVTQR